MKKIVLLIIFQNLFIGFNFSQKIEVLNKNTKKFKGLNLSEIYPLNTNLISDSIEFVETFKVSLKPKSCNANDLYIILNYESNKRGANIYKINNISKPNDKLMTDFVIDLFYATAQIVNKNSLNLIKNTLFIFGDDELYGNKEYDFYMNDKLIEFQSGEYCRIDLDKKIATKITKGRVFGETKIFNYIKDQNPLFFTIGSFGLHDEGNDRVSFHTGSLKPVPKHLGYLCLNLQMENVIKN